MGATISTLNPKSGCRAKQKQSQPAATRIKPFEAAWHFVVCGHTEVYQHKQLLVTHNNTGWLRGSQEPLQAHRPSQLPATITVMDQELSLARTHEVNTSSAQSQVLWSLMKLCPTVTLCFS